MRNQPLEETSGELWTFGLAAVGLILWLCSTGWDWLDAQDARCRTFNPSYVYHFQSDSCIPSNSQPSK